MYLHWDEHAVAVSITRAWTVNVKNTGTAGSTKMQKIPVTG